MRRGIPASQAIQATRNELGNRTATSCRSSRSLLHDRRPSLIAACRSVVRQDESRRTRWIRRAPGRPEAGSTAVSRGVGKLASQARKVGVAMTVSPIRLGQKTAIFIGQTCFPVTPLTAEPRMSVPAREASEWLTNREREGRECLSRASRPSMISSPMRKARKGTGPSDAVRSLTKSFWVVKARFALQVDGPSLSASRRRRRCRGGDRGRPSSRAIRRHRGRRVRRNPSGLPMPQKAATSLPVSVVERVDLPVSVDQVDGGVA